MTPTKPGPAQPGGASPHPGFWKQLIVTLKVLLAAGAVFGGIWLLDSLVVN